MKAVPLLLGLCFALSTTTLFAQTTGFNYQAVLRNSSYQPLTNQTGIATVAIENAAGTVLYQESHGISTDPLGLFNLVIGKGLNPVGNFNNIDWSNGGRFVRITVSANNNTYSFPPSELQAVPYAKVAERVLQSTPYTAGPGISISNNVITNTGDVNPTDDLNVTSIAGGDIQGPFSNLQIKANSIGTGEIQNGSILAEDLAPGVLSSGAWTLNNNNLYNSNSGKVGIGTGATFTSAAKLEIRNPGLSMLKLRSNSYFDTTALLLSNRNASEEGTDFLFQHRREDGLFFRTLSDLAVNTTDNILVLKPDGNIGLRTAFPTAVLHIEDAGYPGGTPMLKVGDDTYFSDVDQSHTVGLYSVSDPTTGALKFGSTGGTLSGKDGWITSSGYMEVGGSDLFLGTKDGRPQGNQTFQRALVHLYNDDLHINFEGDFEGGVYVGGPFLSVPVLHIRGGSDIVEKVNSSQDVRPGEVVVIDPAQPNHVLRSSRAYDKTAIGVVSGAGGIRQGLELQQDGVLDGNVPLAIAGRVKVRVSGQVSPGDLLVSSSEPGKAMKAKRGRRSEGAVIGKALSGKDECGMVLMLVLNR